MQRGPALYDLLRAQPLGRPRCASRSQQNDRLKTLVGTGNHHAGCWFCVKSQQVAKELRNDGKSE
jgi:hypothetical protein